MKNIRELIPKDKGDYETVEKLKLYSFEEIESIIPELLVWLQDMNWPIAGAVSDYLTPFSEKLVPHLIKTLQSEDGMWKYWILIVFGKSISNPVFIEEVRRIALNPTKDDIECEVDLEAKEILDHIK